MKTSLILVLVLAAAGYAASGCGCRGGGTPPAPDSATTKPPENLEDIREAQRKRQPSDPVPEEMTNSNEPAKSSLIEDSGPANRGVRQGRETPR
jgi:hypothetical protein